MAIDSTFALAYRDLATILDNQRRNWDRQIQALESAYRHRDRLTERERYLVEASYSQDVLDDQGQGPFRSTKPCCGSIRPMRRR